MAKFEIIDDDEEIIDADETTLSLHIHNDPVKVIEDALRVINTACVEGKRTTNHTDWGRFMEIQRFAERIRHICEVMKSARPSGVGNG
jgi:hypothetical protein